MLPVFIAQDTKQLNNILHPNKHSDEAGPKMWKLILKILPNILS